MRFFQIILLTFFPRYYRNVQSLRQFDGCAVFFSSEPLYCQSKLGLHHCFDMHTCGNHETPYARVVSSKV